MVATRVGGIPESVEDGKTGYVVERGDAPAIADRILKLAADPDLRERMGRPGASAARTKFDLMQNVGGGVRSYGITVHDPAATGGEQLASIV